MIAVSIQQDREQGFLSMDLIGHAGYAELGKDPVCAGASVLAMTLAQCALAMEEAGALRKKAHLRIRNGRVLVTVKPRPERFDEAALLFWACGTGLRLLAEAYPGYLEIRSAE